MKIKQRSKKKKHLGKIIALIAIAAIVSAIAYSYYKQEASKGEPWQWVTSGPFSINKNQYKLGENVFMIVSDLKPTDVGEIDVFTPKGTTFTAIPFNGTMKSGFKQFFKPITDRKTSLCNPTDLVGNWTVAFRGVPYKAIPFKVINEYIPGAEADSGLQPIPKGLEPC